MVCKDCKNCWNYMVCENGCYGNVDPCEHLITDDEHDNKINDIKKAITTVESQLINHVCISQKEELE